MEAAGALATAGLVAGVIEGREGGLPVHGQCLNCGAQLSGAFCSQCGQNSRPLRSLRHVAGEFLHSLFHFDTKAWRTLPMVLFRPGTLTRNYVYGKRARYISPLATFLLCVFLVFFVFSLTGAANMDGATFRDGEVTAEDLAEARAELEQARTELAEVEANPPADEPTGLSARLARGGVELAERQLQRLESQLAEQEVDAAKPEPSSNSEEPQAIAADGDVPVGDTNSNAMRIGIGIDDEVAAQAIESGESRWQDELREAVERGDVNPNLGHPYLNQRALETLRNPDLALYKVQEAASKFSFLLAPLSLPFIALLFLWKRGVTFYDHIVYALYALSFASLLFITLLLGGRALGANGVAMMVLSNTLLLAVLPAHTYFHLKGAYALGWWSALWRTFFMLLFAVIIASAFTLIVLILGLAG